MCAVSAVGDYYSDKYRKWTDDYIIPSTSPINGIILKPEVTRQEFNEMKKELEEMKRILQVAADYDKRTEQPHCHMEEKVELLKKLAFLFGVDLKGIFDEEDHHNNGISS